MKQIFPDLWQTTAEHPFAGLTTHAYLLVRDAGNVLFYSSGQAADYEQIKSAGGITHQLLSHRDEAGPPLARIKQMIGCQLCCHRLEEQAVSQWCAVDVLFQAREMFLGDIEVIPTPGHTDGSTCFHYPSPHGKTYLFTGDTLFPSRGAWGTYVIPGSGGSESDLKNSLALLRNLAPDMVISSASVGRIAFQEIMPGEWQAIVDRERKAVGDN